jgi:hypothetical protein
MTKRCDRCGGEYDVRFFRRAHAPYEYGASGTHPVCMGCEQTQRDSRKQQSNGRWAVKIRDTIRRHAARLNLTVTQLQQEFGWTVDRMMHEAQHAYANGCSYCGASFAAMGHGLHDLTLDIVNPQDPPYYITNTRWVCQTCNRQKSKTSAKDWSAKRAAWDVWRRLPKLPRQLKLFRE